MKKISVTGIILGLLTIFIGIGYLGNAFFDWTFSIFFDGFWTLFIIIPSFINLIQAKHKTPHVISLGIGALLLSCYRFNISSEDFKNIAIPSVIILIGISILYNAIVKSNSKYKKNPPNPDFKFNDKNDLDSFPNYFTFFSGLDVKNLSSDLKGASVCSIFGGIDCDFKDATINEDICIKVTAIFGGVDMIIPKNVKVVFNPNSIFGGSECKAQCLADDVIAPTIYITSTAIFGGIEIK